MPVNNPTGDSGSGGTVFTTDDDATILAMEYPAGTTIYQLDGDGNVIAIWGQTT